MAAGNTADSSNSLFCLNCSFLEKGNVIIKIYVALAGSRVCDGDPGDISWTIECPGHID